MMFNTLRSKILAITFAMLLVLTIVLSWHVYEYFESTKVLLLRNYYNSIEGFAKDIDKRIIEIENNVRDLALIGYLYNKVGRNQPLTEGAIIEIFKNYEESLGGGIWFEPYKIFPNKKRVGFYAYKNSQGNVVLDESFLSDEYDYHNQGWYKQIIKKVSPNTIVAWSKPYKEGQGSMELMITAGSGIYNENGNLIGISTVDWKMSSISQSISRMKLTPNSFILFADKINDFVLVTNDPYLNDDELVGESLKNVPWFNDSLKGFSYFIYHNKKFIPYVKLLQNKMLLISATPMSELFFDVYFKVIALIIILFLVSCGISLSLYTALKKYILRPIDKLIFYANKIGKGEDVQIEIKKPKEFAQLASTFNKMTEDIKSVAKEREKIDSELSIAKSIQVSTLPRKFPPFPDNKSFDIYALMNPAKEVGGDFYDFYFIDDEHIMFLVADVSGKGIPAALFMMRVKTLIVHLAQFGYSPKELIEIINKKIYKKNDEGFFVTLFAGLVNLTSGKISYVNCGHNKPLIKTANGEYKYLQGDSNIVLGIFEDTKYDILESELQPGDTILLYTDGITEAMNSEGEMFGESRFAECVNKTDDSDIQLMAENIVNEVEKFSGDIPQSDDITMLLFRFNEKMKYPVKEKTFRNVAIKDNYKPFYNWLHSACDEWKVDDALRNKLDMCCEELYANVVFYAYPENPGPIDITLKKDMDTITLIFKDKGLQYNPLEKSDPDITLKPEDRPLGGLGVFMVKQMADEIDYKYSDEHNILTVIFKIL